jgi:hypothetical protein
MNFGVAALISWLCTAVLGGVLVVLWTLRSMSRPLRRNRRPAYGRPPPYIPRPLVIAHVTLALGGLAAWTAALALASELYAYVASGALLVVVLLGSSMFVRWLGSRRARRVTRIPGRAPSESRLPVLVVVFHGLMGATTMALVVLSALRS